VDDQKLMDYFKFDEADLQANRNGQFSTKQAAALSEDGKEDKKYALIGGITGLVVVVFGIGAIVAGLLFPKLLVGAFIGPFVVFFFGILAVKGFRGAFTKFQVKLQKAEGLVNIVKDERTSRHGDGSHSTYYVYEMHVGDGTFQVNSDLAGIMMQGDTYAVYYTQGSENDILSAELISKAK
jgi:hypothetical protein